jgi:hypothetical protein
MPNLALYCQKPKAGILTLTKMMMPNCSHYIAKMQAICCQNGGNVMWSKTYEFSCQTAGILNRNKGILCQKCSYMHSKI